VNNTIPCWNCDGQMKQNGQDTFYWYFKCPKCGKRHTELRDDRPGLSSGSEERLMGGISEYSDKS
jgi:tRNA(Ile2) C34 agmatinyltransferase TiaS